MLADILNILGIIGIILLILLGILLFALLLILFFPITYRIRGTKDTESMEGSIRVSWLFGLLRFRFLYPEPGNAVVKFLCFTLYDTSADKKGTSGKKAKAGTPSGKAVASPGKPPSTTQNTAEQKSVTQESAGSEGTGSKTVEPGTSEETNPKASQPSLSKRKEALERILQKLKELLALIQDEETKALYQHVKLRLGKILWSMRPRKIKADILFGTGSPDTTGYLYGIYGMFSYKLGKDVLVTADFTEAILKGRVFVAGHITVIHLLVNGLKLLLDRKLHRFIKRLRQLKG